MTQEKRFSDEFLNAFVDNQLASEDKDRAYIEISQDETLNRQVCELRKMRDLVQLAYRDVPPPPARATGSSSRRTSAGFGVAATVVLSVGVVLGLQFKSQVNTPEQVANTAAPAVQTAARVAQRTSPKHLAQHKKSTGTSVAAVPSARPVKQIVMTETQSSHRPVATMPRSINDVHIGRVQNKVLIHVADDDPARLTQAMEEIEGLMRYYRDTRASAHVEVVINGRGLELVRIDTSVHAAKIARLLKEYDNLTFAACQNTIDRLKREQGITARLLPGVVVTDSGMAEIMRRQHQGWTYLQV